MYKISGIVEKDALHVHTLTWCRSKSILATSNAQNVGFCHMAAKFKVKSIEAKNKILKKITLRP